MHDEKERAARFERALIGIAAQKPPGATMTIEDEQRAAWVADAVSRYEARASRPGPAPAAATSEEAPARPRRARRRPRKVTGERPKRGRPRKVQPPPEG